MWRIDDDMVFVLEVLVVLAWLAYCARTSRRVELDEAAEGDVDLERMDRCTREYEAHGGAFERAPRLSRREAARRRKAREQGEVRS